MAGTTTNFLWPFPTNPDAALVAGDMQSLASAIDSTLGNSWTNYTPTWTSTGVAPVLGTGTIRGRFKLFGKWGIANGQLTMGGTTTFGTGNYRFGLPAGWTMETSAPTISNRGYGAVNDSAPIASYPITILLSSSTTISMRSNGTADISPTVPITFASGDTISWTILVELV